MSDTPTVIARFVWPFRTVSREFGLDSKEAWEHFGITQAQLENPDTRIPVEVTTQLAEWVVAATGLPDYGLRAAEAAEPGMFDLPEYAARCQPTLGGALQRITHLVPLLSDTGWLEFDVQGDVARIVVSPTPSTNVHPASIEFSLAYLIIAGRRMTGVEYEPAAVRFTHPAPSDTSHHERLFRCPLEFGAGENAILTPKTLLELPLRFADSRLAMLLDQATEHLLAKIGPPGTFADEVRRLVTKHLPSDGAPVTAIADALGVTPRTLHRRLAEESTNFRELADDVRRGLAIAHLQQPSLAIAEVAYLTGFSSVQAFSRAFKRWIGTTPGEYRKQPTQAHDFR